MFSMFRLSQRVFFTERGLQPAAFKDSPRAGHLLGWLEALGRSPLLSWRNSRQARGLRAACCRCPSGQLAGQEFPAIHSTLSPSMPQQAAGITAAASCLAVHGRWPGSRQDPAQAIPKRHRTALRPSSFPNFRIVHHYPSSSSTLTRQNRALPAVSNETVRRNQPGVGGSVGLSTTVVPTGGVLVQVSAAKVSEYSTT
jgi:hypothetical protein